jgi:hypothetical protein
MTSFKAKVQSTRALHVLAIPRGQLDIDDYLSASTDASSRTRAILLIMVVASVLVLTGLFNSLQSSWMHRRVLSLGRADNQYLISKLGLPPDSRLLSQQDYQFANELYKQRQQALCAAVEAAYVEGSFIIKVPFLGVTFDVNDLGVIGGIGFLVILSCYRFFLARELDNLHISFTAAREAPPGSLASFYSLLAMRQVFTIPESGFIKSSRFLLYLPKLITWVPVALLISVAAHDLQTSFIAHALGYIRFRIELACQILCIGLVFMLAISITTRLVLMDKIWNVVGFYLTHKEINPDGAEALWNEVFVGDAAPVKKEALSGAVYSG